ncbi:DUF4229 domain-containing protein [Nocardioides sp.]|uniref:DUF4229 domain-containing protein n=1 Tax=Nocardioides sp. TaxID=35761 RepID=UPI00271B0963|nr:DUF4229 domain-containing protein [Nocardioides sp.]MDO9455491.1 DUF4229 domain-containing protein [Nocardioides sp.]
MKDFVVYTLLRLGLFLLTWGAVTGAWLLIADKAALGLTFLIALVLSGVGSYWVLAGPREKLARHVEARAERATAAFEERRAREDAEAADADPVADEKK